MEVKGEAIASNEIESQQSIHGRGNVEMKRKVLDEQE